MKQKIQQLLKQSLHALVDSGELQADLVPQNMPVEHARRDGQGDYASGVALGLARSSGYKPRDLALMIQDKLPAASFIASTEVAGPGFINFFLSEQALIDVVADVLEQRETYGAGIVENPEKILLEYVSVNPTGPLHVGHGRGAAFGDSLARLLRTAGHQVDTEYYVNDIGRQMDILGFSVCIRYLQLEGKQATLPEGAYKGSYVAEIAERFKQQRAQDLEFDDVASFRPEGSSKDEIIDSLIRQTREWLGFDQFEVIRNFALEEMIKVIRADLETIGVSLDEWFYESQVAESGEIEQTIEILESSDSLYESEGATWFRSSEFGDEKDRVLRRSNGGLTYFASDIAYHLNKMRRGHDYVVNIWGADHHGYVARMKAAVQAAGENPDRLRIFLVQIAALWRGEEKIPMSTREGQFVSLEEMVDEIGKDATRFFYVLRKPEQHLDFDLELAKAESNENPVYYVQYAHARICSVFNQLSERGIVRGNAQNNATLTHEVELNLIRRISRYPEVIESAASGFEPHQVAYYLRDLSTDFHSFYNRIRILDCDPELRDARLNLIDAVRQVLVNGLAILGVSAPDAM